MVKLRFKLIVKGFRSEKFSCCLVSSYLGRARPLAVGQIGRRVIFLLWHRGRILRGVRL